jgi:hypothetical protein
LILKIRGWISCADLHLDTAEQFIGRFYNYLAQHTLVEFEPHANNRVSHDDIHIASKAYDLPIQLKQALHPLVSPACFGPIR